MPIMARRDLLKSAVILGAGLPAVRGAQSAESQEIPDTFEASQLFVDLERVEQLENIKQDFHPAEKRSANPVFRNHDKIVRLRR